jgi:hypothetical protein
MRNIFLISSQCHCHLCLITLEEKPQLKSYRGAVANGVFYWQSLYECKRRRRIFKGFSQDGGQADFAKNICASPFNKDILNDDNFSQVNADGQLFYRDSFKEINNWKAMHRAILR